MWEIDGDSFDSLEDAGMHEVANLSLDKPESEAIALTDASGEAQVRDYQEDIGEE
ncbi:Dimer_Tnp_hAT domain-containing protein [Cucumis melo var. makuwa]|uniref:Dimer_Tnp_hAT domain-containing protein n=1 Tax=Cucumis melo var. makuwa TaxID=1194695 RepID=A0A5D3BFW7_CUCMM|nr:Dimer_Tnp_hAT domain-containing protein [Cucumis melo var. makuwa]